ncbi:MAG: carboxypeptidase regulatory-like domain-containing protein [Acidobacteria bacterium]|nr:carboxypeptidase regulatory-like domain-containing protein [Acidobacteriota bacterium]
MNRHTPLALLRGAAISVALLLPFSVAMFPTQMAAQRQAASRTVHGKVTEKGGGPVKGAVVHLKDLRALSQKSFITPEDGTFRFGQLNTNSDYEVWAEIDGKKSSVKRISSFEAKNTFEISLTID